MNAVEIEQAVSELSAQPFDAAEFPYALLEAFGNKATTIKRLRKGASNASDIAGGVLQRNNIRVLVWTHATFRFAVDEIGVEAFDDRLIAVDEFVTDYERKDRRLRVIYSNGTESDLLLRSLQRALYKDEAGRRITDPSAGPLFSSQVEDDDTENGTIYVLRSLSDHPNIATERELIHKIGVTGGKLETRLANAKLDPTFLMADVEVMATYKLYNINRTKLENLIHRFFASARLDLDIEDRFGHLTKTKEWFLVPLPAIDEAVEKIQDGTIADFSYDPSTASLKRN